MHCRGLLGSLVARRGCMLQLVCRELPVHHPHGAATARACKPAAAPDGETHAPPRRVGGEHRD
eukprot:12304254-Alexandrium_andersonii.AAC.1